MGVEVSLPAGWVLAPDGIPVRPISLPDGGLIGIAEGRIPPGDYGVHLHYSLEQVTYLVSGRLRVLMGSPEELAELEAGQAVLTEPARTLSFHNDGPDDAVVLFICVPPYPPDDSDTGRPEAHRALSSDERALARERQRAAREAIGAVYARRSVRLSTEA
jgi:mannose-6-phosphate isomerase-like protein (cupin superfamily)